MIDELAFNLVRGTALAGGRSQNAASEPRVSRRSCLGRIAAVAFLCHGGQALAHETPPARSGKVLLVRGILTVFSLGLDDLADLLRRQGYDTEVVPACLAYCAVDDIHAKYLKGELQGPLVLIGHSMGGDMLPGLANYLAQNRRPVDLLVMIDSTFPSPCPGNVRRCVNLYQSNFSPEWFRLFRGAPMQAQTSETQLVNVDIRQLTVHPDVARLDHFNIEESPWIHQLVLNEVNKVMDLPVEQTVRAQDPPRERYLSPLSPFSSQNVRIFR